ncbi:SDR family oxidoreductase [Pseudonocardia nematodicida]|uniref:SDR family oxidoreductase n=1 Tax=Pseudonocardia nematodicida TaxID=1206997 RepID=A0ABV1KBH5_9PSEU
MEPPHEPRTALVGGGAGGIGSATAAALLERGHRVVLAGRTAASLDAAVAALGGGPRVDRIVCDLADPAAAAAAADDLRDELDVLVVNTGGPPPGAVLEVCEKAWYAAFDLLVTGPLAMLRAALPAMAGRGFGRAVVITGTAVRRPQPGLALSTVLRSATTAAAGLAAREYADRGVTVNCVALGATHTPRRREILESRATALGTDVDTAAARDEADIPAGRAADPAEIAAAVAFLASPAAGYVNGTVLTVDGGLTGTA